MNRLQGEFRPSGPDLYTFDDRAFQMESDFADRFQVAYLPIRKERKLGRLAAGLGVLAAVVIIFQLFFRYDYLSTSAGMWRVDRMTHQVCKVLQNGGVNCAAGVESGRPSPSTSTSTSTSISVSR